VAIRIRFPSRERFIAILNQRCPNCLQGKVFDGILHMRERCLVCDHVFIREQGYFQGAMYVSYGLGLFVAGLLTAVTIAVLPSHSDTMALFIIIPVFLVTVPVLFRYSRVIWMHLFYRAF
jgi:uncharacterized protein (DUF983 family)